MAYNTEYSSPHDHEWYMKRAIKEADKALKKQEAPIGAVIVHKGKIIARGHNEKELKQDPTMHAEITAIKKAAKKLGSWRLTECEMYVTLEPCAMCAGAIVQARIPKLYIGTADPKSGATGSVLNITDVPGLNHKVDVCFGILQEECSKMLKDFFRSLRERKNKG